MVRCVQLLLFQYLYEKFCVRVRSSHKIDSLNANLEVLSVGKSGTKLEMFRVAEAGPNISTKVVYSVGGCEVEQVVMKIPEIDRRNGKLQVHRWIQYIAPHTVFVHTPPFSMHPSQMANPRTSMYISLRHHVVNFFLLSLPAQVPSGLLSPS